jgi:hypothetical protein
MLYRPLRVVVCLLALTAAANAEDWKPIDPAHVAMKTPAVEKDADAEVIFWEVRINDSDWDLVFNHYIRIKVFTERGKESQSKIDIHYFGHHRLVDIGARTIKPDGTIVEMKKDAVFDRTIVKISGFKVNSKSFAMPAVEPGAIIEYRWKEIRPNTLAHNVRLQFQRDIPVQSVTYLFKPPTQRSPFSRMGLMSRMFNGQSTPFIRSKDGFYSTSMSNVPAFREEKQMPPEDQVRTWMLIFYSDERPQRPEDYWPRRGKELYDENKTYMRVNDEIKKAAAAAIGDATTDDEKLKRLFDFVRSKVKNIYDDAAGFTASQREKMKENNAPWDTLKRGTGTGDDINFLFAALCIAAGFDARLAELADRSDIFFDPNFTNPYFMVTSDIAVKVGDGWRFFDPATTYVPYGMLRWQEEGMSALITDPKAGFFVSTPMSSADKSVARRTARLKLSEDGTLEGDVRMEYTGHSGHAMKEANDEDSPTQREDNLKDLIKRRMSTAELSDIKIENVTDGTKPFVYSYHIRVPGYAQRTGKRLFLQPSFFERGRASMFTAGERVHDIYFRYYWLEQDSIEIDLPAGYELDHAEQPPPFRVTNVVDYEVKMQVVNKKEKLLFNRKFSFQGFLFPVSSYKGVKQVFDALHESDSHSITLKQASASSQD